MGIYEDMANVAVGLLSEYGTNMTLHHGIDSHRDAVTNEIQYTELATVLKGFITSYSDLFTQSADTNLVKGDVKIIVEATYGKPHIGNTIVTNNNKLYRIRNVTPMAPAGIPVYYTLLATSYEEIETQVDVYTKLLSHLEPGDIVASPILESPPKWRVIEHDFINANATLLLLDKVSQAIGPKPFQARGYPLRPWVDTYLRNRVLLGDFRNTLDATFRQEILSVPVYTENSPSQETLFSLSKVELGITADPGKNSGTALSYFATDAHRQARDDDQKTWAYWCRDVYGIDASGQVATLNPSNEHYVRPACCLRGTVNVAQNAEGVWEIQWP